MRAWLVLALLLVPLASAHSHYSFEHAESLKPLIEWREYGPDAFSEAAAQNKPVFLLLTAPSWCYWCQVYESEEYLFHPDIINYINEELIPIYVDADRRQDLTRKYLEGGWPSTTIMTPSRERLFGFSGPRPVSFMLTNMQSARDFVQKNGFSNTIDYGYVEEALSIPAESQLSSYTNFFAGTILQSYDSLHGGFGTGQKFPQGRTLDFSLDLYELTGEKRWLELVQNTLKNQYTKREEIKTNYNLFDPVEGGFHRYGTQRDWSPPHYEKMLYDNARLLKAYAHLSEVATEPVVEQVVSKTIEYVEENWYDPEGGFYGNTDVHGEDHYYGQDPRPTPKARVEETKYADWNAEMILTYVYLWEITGEEKYRAIARKSLDFLAKDMVTQQGAYHFTKDGKTGVRGSLLDNAYIILAFVEASQAMDDVKYERVAEYVANYTLANLYDWRSGGFFERNSPDRDLYAPGEEIDVNKPGEENGIIAYALLKLYTQTNQSPLLIAGLRTLGSKIGGVGGLDRGYYYAKAAQFTTQHGLLQDYEAREDELIFLEQQEQDAFWLNDLLAQQSSEVTGFVVAEEGLDQLDSPLLLLVLVALLAGVISFASPCTLPIVPAYLAYAFKSSQQNIKGMTWSFFLGLVSLFTLLGMSATALGGLLRSQLTALSRVSGAVIMLIGLYILLGKGFSGFKMKQRKPTTYIGSFLFGAAMGVSWTPCVGPILVAILLLASTATSALSGGLLLFSYGVGLSLPLLALSAYLGRINKAGRLWRILQGKEYRFRLMNKDRSVHTTTLISGALFVILGYLMFSGTLYTFNQYLVSSGFQKLIFGVEEWLLGLVS